MDIVAFINGGTSTSFQLEVSVKIDQVTPADVTVVSFYDSSLADADSDVTDYDMDFRPLGASSRFDTAAYRQLRALLHDYDILHTHYNFVGSAGRLASIGTDTKIVNTEHTDHRRMSHLQNAVNAPTYPAIDTMVFNSQSTRDSLRAYERPFLTGTDCRVVHNGVDFDRLRKGQERSDIPDLPAGPKIVTAARLVPVKNLDTLVRAMKSVVASISDAQLVVIGDGPEQPKLQRLAADLDLSESTTFLGRLEREQVYGTIAQCDVFAVPSLYEGFCNAAVEAMGLGLPVVASDIDVLREVVDDAGRFADPRDPEEFAEQIITVLTDDELRQQLGSDGSTRAAENFTIEKSAKQYYDIYTELVEGDGN